MLQGGYFLGNMSGGSSGGSSEDMYIDADGNIIYSPFDPIYIDEEEKVFYSNEDKNGVIYMEDGKLYVEKVV